MKNLLKKVLASYALIGILTSILLHGFMHACLLYFGTTPAGVDGFEGLICVMPVLPLGILSIPFGNMELSYFGFGILSVILTGLVGAIWQHIKTRRFDFDNKVQAGVEIVLIILIIVFTITYNIQPNPSPLQEMESDLQIREEAIKTGNWKLCKRIAEDIHENQCFVAYALSTGNWSVCDEAPSPPDCLRMIRK